MKPYLKGYVCVAVYLDDVSSSRLRMRLKESLSFLRSMLKGST